MAASPPSAPPPSADVPDPGIADPRVAGLRIVVAGVSSSGKSTVSEALARRLGARALDADDFHPEANVRKMAAGVPLTDEDRWPWLARLNSELRSAADRSQTVVLACSALKVVYRERLARDVPGFRFVLLNGAQEVLAQRAAARSHRYMPASLLDSQLATLEPLAPGSGWEIDIALPVERIVDEITARLR